MVRVYRGADGGRRCTVFGLRIHHGPVGLFCAVLGALIAYHDRRDRREWLRFRNP